MNMQSANFVLPSVSSADMSKDDQGALLVNQATAVIVSAWLEHATALCQIGEFTTGQYEHNRYAFMLTRDELVQFVNDVQEALRQF